MMKCEWRISKTTAGTARSLLCLSLIAVLPLFLGCQAMYFLTTNENKTVKAEYAKIGHRKVAVVVWVDRLTIDTDPKSRRRVCDSVIYDLKKHLPDARFIKAQEIEEFQEHSGLDWEGMPQVEICKQLKCDLVLRVDVLKYTTRAREAHELRRGQVEATVSLYEAESGERAVYSADISASYPPKGKQAATELTDSELIREAVTQFGQAVGQKFYDHEVSLRGRDQ